ncbi:hypothetical protein [Pseudomonas phage KP1]|uniref:Uncharacterized protein n=1 Tax=Pseudomonas phage KP1 TaxID=2562463 RepID=A0A6G5QAM6_9CAUD|nr:hypothetical protein PM391_gp35 [Pseudomonas phage KP1]QBZ71745.1 hypothetical protein [Pseudomonas phage KP1]
MKFNGCGTNTKESMRLRNERNNGRSKHLHCCCSYCVYMADFIMTPDKLAKSGSEHAHQTALFAYTAVAYLHGFDAADEWCKTGVFPKLVEGQPPAVPALQWFHAIHNQGHGDKVRGGMAKAEGVRKGIADCFLPWPILDPHTAYKTIMWCGLYIEMKKPSEQPKSETAKGGVSDEQAKFGKYAKSVGYGFAVCYSWEHAASVLRSYIEWSG